MVIFGGLEIVVGGYLVHRYHKNKNEKKRLHDEAVARRNHTFPGAKPSSYPPPSPQSPQYQHPPVIPPQKYACYAPQPTSQSPLQTQGYPRPPPPPGPPPHAQPFTIPRRPLPQQLPQIIQPLQRSDSFATISRMPIADGIRPQDTPSEEVTPPLPPRRHFTALEPIPQQQALHSPYGNAGFSVSTPAFGATPTSPAMTYVLSPRRADERHVIDDNWETYQQDYRPGYPVSESTQLGEDDPPPPYRP